MNKLLILIIFLAIALVLVFRSGINQTFDDNNYKLLAIQVSQGKYNITESPYGYGVLFICITYISGALFGFDKFGLTILTSVMPYFILILLTYVLAKKAKQDENTALISSFLVAIMPFVVGYSTRLLPDLLMGVIAISALILFLGDAKKEWFLSGLVAGLLIYIKLSGAIFFIPFALYALFSSRRNYVLLGLIIAVIAYLGLFLAFTGNPFYTIQNYSAFQSNLNNLTSFNGNTGILFVMLGLIQLQPGSLYNQVWSLGLVLWFALIASYIAILKKSKPMQFLAMICWGFILYMSFGTISLAHYTFGPVIGRYFAIIAGPISVLTAYMVYICQQNLQKLFSNYKANLITVLILAFITISLIPTLYILISIK